MNKGDVFYVAQIDLINNRFSVSAEIGGVVVSFPRTLATNLRAIPDDIPVNSLLITQHTPLPSAEICVAGENLNQPTIVNSYICSGANAAARSWVIDGLATNLAVGDKIYVVGNTNEAANNTYTTTSVQLNVPSAGKTTIVTFEPFSIGATASGYVNVKARVDNGSTPVWVS